MDWNAILPSVITGLVTLGGVLLSSNAKQAVIEEKIEQLTREVREHNNFALRVPLLEQRVDILERERKATTNGKQ